MLGGKELKKMGGSGGLAMCLGRERFFGVSFFGKEEEGMSWHGGWKQRLWWKF